MATPRKSAYHIADTSGAWTLRSGGGARPTVIVWGTTPAPDAALDRLARAGFAVLTPPPRAGSADLQRALESLPPPLGVAFLEPPDPDLSKALNAGGIRWLSVNGNWDDIPRWFAGGRP